ncbi:helix-turn-helix domain-containing protein [Spirosoma sp. BT702]|uniref:histidine kinase n=1 Tax=Spirosoma profusum TaxID=2771354 RepID=A0A926XXF3_9BACT|nr:helix-turn-helix domain-containing protein [Spirosoma profusum]
MILLIGLCTWAEAQPYVAWVKHYGPEDGLANREVNAIFQDRQGFMWFGTKFGLSRFDGKTFTTFTKDRNGLNFDDIQSIAQDADGLLWLMGPYGESRITLFNPLNGTAIPFEKKFNRQLITEPLNTPQRLLGSPDGTIFFANRQPAALATYHPKSGLHYVQLPQYKKLAVLHVTARNTVWAFADGTDLVELTAQGRVLHHFPHHLRHVITCLGQRNAGSEFFYLVADSTDSATSTFYRVDESGHRYKLPRSWQPANRQYLFPVYYALDKTGLHWDGVHLKDSTNRTILDITDQLAGEAIVNRSFFRDRDGWMWLGTSFGLYQVKLTPNYFRRLFYDATYTGEKTAAIRAITVIGDTVYANFEKFGLFTTNVSGGLVKKLFGNNVSTEALANSQSGKLALGTGTQLIEYELKTGANKAFQFPYGFTAWALHQLHTDQWIAGGRLGLWWVETKTGQFRPFTQFNQFTELAQSHVLHIAPDWQGTLWICANTGLYSIDPIKGITARYWSGGKGNFYLPADNYQHYYVDQKGIYWLATANAGLIRWDRRTHQYRQFRRSEGLSNDNLYAVYADKRGHLWLSSDYGVMQFDPIRFTTKTYFVQDGITHNEFNRISHFQDQRGRIYFGGLNGVTAFDPQDFIVEPPSAQLPIRLVSFRQLDQARDQLIDKTEEVAKSNQIVIRPGDQTSVVEFALLNFTDGEKNVYAYQFKGLNNAWTQQTESSLRLGNLPYGTYQLLIKGQSANGQWSSNVLTIDVDVQRPFYLQIWFLVLAVLLTIAVIWGWLKWRIWNHQQEQLRLQSEIHQATARIEADKQLIEQQAKALLQLDEAKSRFFTNISHEFRTPLTVILGMAADLKRQATAEPERQLRRTGDLIERNGRNLLRLINQILDLSKLEAGEMQWQPIRADLVRFTRYVTESFHTIASLKNITLHFQADEDVLETDFDKDKLQDILSNLLTNALKFTPDGGQVYLNLSAGTQEDSLQRQGYYEAVSTNWKPNDVWISIRVRDTGSGIVAANLPLIFDRFFQQSTNTVSSQSVAELGGTGIGLSLVRELVMLMQGGLAVRSRVGEGTEFIVQLRQTRLAPLISQSLDDPESHSSEETDTVVTMADTGEEKPMLLLVEDNEDVADYIITCIQADYRILRAENGQKGIDLALETIPDLILSDVMMPLKDGFQVCDTLKNDSRTSHIPIVLLTARAAVSDRISGLRRGADAYLTKPFQREELDVVLSNLLKTRRQLQLHYSQQALNTVSPDLALADDGRSLEDQFLHKLRLALEPQLSQDQLSIDALCQQVGMSRSSLHRKITGLTGMPLTRYARSLRLTRAKELLTSSELNISEVAYAVGFDDPKYFSRVFSEEFGISPANFRLLEH